MTSMSTGSGRKYTSLKEHRWPINHGRRRRERRAVGKRGMEPPVQSAWKNAYHATVAIPAYAWILFYPSSILQQIPSLSVWPVFAPLVPGMQHDPLFAQYSRGRDDVPHVFNDPISGHEIKRISQVAAVRPAHLTDTTLFLSSRAVDITCTRANPPSYSTAKSYWALLPQGLVTQSSGRLHPARSTSCCDLPDLVRWSVSAAKYSCSALQLWC